ncbi:MAG: hypothetical protein QHJ73_15425, partial [Armatimonadota bacterium]|nr:hypothetical protein [Armatimonadota bacterium]
MEKAGGAITFHHARLAGLRRFTLVLWFRPLSAAGPARLFWLTPEWDVLLSGNAVHFKVKSAGTDHTFSPPRGQGVVSEGWHFLTIAADLTAGTALLYLGTPERAPAPVARWEEIPPPDPGEGAVEVGNLAGIRPFKGWVDEIRLYGRVLSEEEVQAAYRESSPRPVRLGECVVPRERMPGLDFRYSDVCFSTRSVRKESLETIRAFQANRVVWVYTADPQFVRALHELGATVQGTVNTIPRTPDLSAYCVDLDGTPLVAPWMVAFNRRDPPKWGCNNQPAYREAVLDAARKALDAGVDWIQFDDWALIVSAHSWGGGCFCNRCMAGFAAFLAAQPLERLREAGIDRVEGFDYRRFLAEKHGIRDAATYKARRAALPTTPLFEEFQRHSVRAYFRDLRLALDRHAKRRVPLSINSNLTDPSQNRNFMADMVDFFLGETHSPTLADLAICARSALALGKHQIVSPLPRSLPEARVALAATYALGEFYLVPWDLYMGSDATGIQPRYFGTVEEYGDLYRFVRQHPNLFDECEAAATVCVVVNTDRYDPEKTRALVNRLLRAQVPFAFAFSGRRFFEQRLDPAHLARFHLLLRLNELAEFPPEDRNALQAAQESAALLSGDGVDDAVLESLAPALAWGPAG